jgi:alkylation response protein AidB-like acyl-CoA dehydrogenase
MTLPPSRWSALSLLIVDDEPGMRSFLAKEGVPNADQWEKDRLVPKSFWQKAGEVGMLCPTVPEAYGGLREAEAATLLRDFFSARR